MLHHDHSQVTVAPASEPVTLAEAKAHLRVNHANDDASIDGLIVAAREWVEAFTGRSLVTQTRTYVLDGFPVEDDFIALPGSPIQSVTLVSYVDAAGATQTWGAANYVVDSTADPGGIFLAYGASWPDTRDQRHAVTITYVAGYTIVPQRIKQAMLLIIGELYARRELAIVGAAINEVPFAVQALLTPFRLVYL